MVSIPNYCKACRLAPCRCGKLLAILIVLLGACGDNAVDPFAQPPAIAQSPESTVVRRGTYELAPVAANQDTVSWLLSEDGIVMIPLRGTSRAAKLGWVRVRGKTAAEPDVAIVDQVDNDSLVLQTSITGTLVDGIAVHDLVEPLYLGSDGEIIWIRVIAHGAPVELYAVTWGQP